MNLLMQWLAPETVRLIALALIHFLWQGAVLAAFAYAAMILCRSAASRYAVGITMLALMLAAPVITFGLLSVSDVASGPASVSQQCCTHNSETTARVLAAFTAKTDSSVQQDAPRPDYLFFLVELWFAGVLLLSLRSAGGFLLVERLRRRESSPVNDDVLSICLALQNRLRLKRIISCCKSIYLDAPAVAGWLRPVVLLPASAISGLTTAQLEAVIAHELAHIRRYDAFVNLFQIGTETLLFYHPAVWWLGKRIREERENCCDDVAVAVCGSPVTYAHALTSMAQSRVAPALAMAANRGALATRVARLLNVNSSQRSLRATGLSAVVVCLSGALLAGSALVNVARTVHAAQAEPQMQVASPARTVVSANGSVLIAGPFSPTPKPVTPKLADKHVLAFVPAPDPEQQETPAPPPGAAAKPAQASEPAAKPSYIDAMKEAGFDHLTVDELIGLKVQGVTPEYVKQMRDLGMRPDVNQFIGMKSQGIDSEYVREMRAASGSSFDINALIGMKVQSVTPEYIKQIRELGLRTDPDNIIGMKVQGVTPDYVKNLRALGIKVEGDDVIGMRVQGIDADYVKSINEAGLHPDAHELIGMKVQGINAAYLREMQTAGFKMNVSEAISAKVQGITPEFIAKVRSRGFQNLTFDKLMALKHSGVIDAQR